MPDRTPGNPGHPGDPSDQTPSTRRVIDGPSDDPMGVEDRNRTGDEGTHTPRRDHAAGGTPGRADHDQRDAHSPGDELDERRAREDRERGGER